jgi:chromosome segregation ATPase
VSRYKPDGAISFYLSDLVRSQTSTCVPGPPGNAEELRPSEREISGTKDSEMKVIRAELDLKRMECSDTTHLLEQAQKELKDVKDALRKSREEVWTLAAENKALLAEMNGVKEVLTRSRNEFQQLQRDASGLLERLGTVVLDGMGSLGSR